MICAILSNNHFIETMLNLPNELRCIVISYLGVSPFCMLRETCKWFCQDELWDIYLRNMHTKSECLDDRETSARDKIKYIHQMHNVLLFPLFASPTQLQYRYTLSRINNYESLHNIQLPLDIKKHLIERSMYIGILIDLTITPVINSYDNIEIVEDVGGASVILEKGTPYTIIRLNPIRW